LKIGRQTERSSAICASNAQTIVVRGKDLCQELLGRTSFTDYFWLLLTGQQPTAAQRGMLDATLVAIAEHGLVPSVVASRMTLAAAPEALQGAVAAGILGCGSVILGSAEAAGRFLGDILARAGNDDVDAAVKTVVTELRATKRPIPGYGHPQHKGEDPRATRLFAVARELGVHGRHCAAALRVDALLPEVTGKTLRLNVSGAIPAVLLDAGFPAGALKGVPILARTASLIAHLLEEQQRAIGFVMAHGASSAISYDGPAPEGFVAEGA
jgi:citrate synthase